MPVSLPFRPFFETRTALVNYPGFCVGLTTLAEDALRGSQYACHDHQDLLRSHGMLPSMSRTGNCYDNAVMGSYFGTLKAEWVHHCNYLTRSQAKRDIFEYIEVFYNREWVHSSLGYLSPHDYDCRRACCLNGRMELRHYLHEQAIWITTHRYGKIVGQK